MLIEGPSLWALAFAMISFNVCRYLLSLRMNSITYNNGTQIKSQIANPNANARYELALTTICISFVPTFQGRLSLVSSDRWIELLSRFRRLSSLYINYSWLSEHLLQALSHCSQGRLKLISVKVSTKVKVMV